MDEPVKNFDATSSNNSDPLYCIVCEQKIPDGNWFARIPIGERRVAMCRPRCAELFIEHRAQCLARLERS